MVIAASQWSLGHSNGHTGCPGLTMGSAGMSCPHGHQIGGAAGVMAASSYPPPPPPQAMLLGNGSGGMGVLSGLGPSQSSSFHGPPLPTCNPCPTAANNFNSVPLPGPSGSRWGPRTSCPVHSPFRARLPNGGGPICSGHQVSGLIEFRLIIGKDGRTMEGP